MNPLNKIFEQSSDAVFGIDAEGKIRFANNIFERMTGRFREQIYNQTCHDILCGTDIHGTSCCNSACPLIPINQRQSKQPQAFDLIIKHHTGRELLVNVGCCEIPQQLQEQAGQVTVYFNLRQFEQNRLLQLIKTVTEENNNPNQLTPRETEILQQATTGMKTSQIADKLCVSTQTIRCHFRNIYQKIGVHSRTEAVLFAFQKGLVPKR